MALHATYRDSGQVTVIDMGGRITLGDGSALLRTTVRKLLEENRTRILINLADVDYIDSSGIGELVQAYTSVKNRGGELKLLHLTKKVKDLLQITKLFTVFDVHENEASAVGSFV
jgi:anti-sigma B factor antagonist